MNANLISLRESLSVWSITHILSCCVAKLSKITHLKQGVRITRLPVLPSDSSSQQLISNSPE